MKKPLIMIGIILSFFLVSVTYVSSQEICGCTNKFNGKLRILNDGDNCRRWENILCWETGVGPQGPPGEDGSDVLYELCELYMLTGNPYPLKCWNCGNGILEPMEECDDGNTADGDGCNHNCTLGRFTDMGNGTVRDNISGLIWLKDANAFGAMNFVDACDTADSLSTGEHGLTDGSADGDWRLPTIEEWEAFVVTNYAYPALCDTIGTGQWSQGDAFNNVQSSIYWSNTVWPTTPGVEGCGDHCNACMNMADGQTENLADYDSYYVWPCR